MVMKEKTGQTGTLPLSHRIEYSFLRGIGGIVRTLPYKAALAFGCMLARGSFFIVRKRVQTAEHRIRLVLGDEIPQERVKSIAWQSWRNIFFSAIEMLRLPVTDYDFVKQHFDASATISALHKIKNSGSGGIIALPHCGSWELAAHMAYFDGIPLFSIAADQRNTLVNDEMNRLRRYHGIETIARGSGTMRQVLRKLKQGGFLTILPDVRKRTPGLEMDFLGAKANLGEGMALFAIQTGVPVIPCIVTRKGWTNHIIQSSEPIWPDKTLDKQQDMIRMTRSALDYIERQIKTQPEQWFWYNKRWIHDPVEG